MALMRIDKFLADAGIGTRSEIKKYIKKGSVQVNGMPIQKPDIKIETAKDSVTFQHQIIHLEEFEYYLLNKPAGYVSATTDHTAPTVLSLIESRRKDLFPVGRLDKDTEGLLLITNDGALSHRLLSPKYHVDKTYYAIVEGNVNEQDIHLFSQGLVVGDADLHTALPAKLSIVADYNAEENLSYVNITIQEGKFHQIKRMFQTVGKKVIYLKRISFGTLTLPEDLPCGRYRRVTEEELELLKK
ncbi:MAG: rRNA pseudouridine synthase [Clostridium sp.]|nr:rRNA pseudouridine synthase [Clostridium sp.]